MATRIAIVGAGCAALGAATRLLDRRDLDLKITMLEANDLIGGRARTSAVPGLPVDLGPQFIQDPEVNPWDLILKSMPDYDESKVKMLFMNALYRMRVDDKWITSDGNDTISEADKQLGEQSRLASGFKNAPVMTGNAPEFFKGQQYLRLSLGSSNYGAITESAEPWQYLVSDQARQAEVPSAFNVYAPGGLGTLVKSYGEQLISANPDKLAFLPKKIVTDIRESEDIVTVYTADDENEDYDYCIVTAPCGEIEKIRFDPPLSGEHTRANKFIKLGSYKKVAFRPKEFPKGDPLKKAKQRDSIEENYEYYIYDKDRDTVWQYFRLPTQPDILICVTAGDSARRLDDLPDKDAAAMVTKLLRDAYETGNFAPQENAVVVTNWTHAPHIHGAYSYTRYDGTLDPDNRIPYEARERIVEPHGRVYFAGEATYILAYGTIHGAYFSGSSAAREILKLLPAELLQ